MKKLILIIYLVVLGHCLFAEVVVYEVRPVSDTFVVNPGTGNTNHTNAAIYNYGGAGSRSIASATAHAYLEENGMIIINAEPKGEFISLLRLDFSSFAGTVATELVLNMYISNGNQAAYDMFNYIGSAGNFDLSWISSDWIQGTGAPHETPSNSLNGISYVGLQELLYDEPPHWMDVFYYTAENPYGAPQWFEYTLDLNNGYYADLQDMISQGQTVTFMLSPSRGSDVAFNFCAYVQLRDDGGGRLRENGPILDVTIDEDPNALPQVANCYTDVAVSGQSHTGGFIGYNACKVENCYAVGSIEADISDPNGAIGGLFGEDRCGSSHCYWNKETSGIIELADDAGLTTAEMMIQASFEEWDFSSDDGDLPEWMMLRPGQDYPRLAWQEIIIGDIAGLYGVNLTDITVLMGCWLNEPLGACADSDIDSNGKVNLTDFAMLAGHWLQGQ